MRRLLLLIVLGAVGPAVAQGQSIEAVPTPPPSITPAAPHMGDDGSSSTFDPSSSQCSWASDEYGCAGSCCASRWTFSADTLFLDRNFRSHTFLGQTEALPAGTPVSPLFPNGSSMNAGMRLQLNYLLDDAMSLEAVYFGLQQWSNSGSVAGNPLTGVAAFSPYTQSDVLLGGFDQSLGYSYSSRLNNAELNFRAPVAQSGPWTRDNLVGIRFVELGEGFNLTGQDQFFNVTEKLDSHTNNSLLGTQVGTAVRGNWDRWQLSMTGKTGLFANFVAERFSNLNSTGVATGFPPGFVPITRAKSATEVAGVLDFSAIATYRVNAHWSLRGGYQLLYLAGVALASQQLSGYSHGGDVFLHGPSAGFQYTR